MLGEKVNISSRVLGRYLAGAEPIPDALILRIVDLLLDELDGARGDK
jgi:hypothetical protein